MLDVLLVYLFVSGCGRVLFVHIHVNVWFEWRISPAESGARSLYGALF